MINNNFIDNYIIYKVNNNEPINYNTKTQQLIFKRIKNNYYLFPHNEPAIDLILSDPPEIVQKIIIPSMEELKNFNKEDQEIIIYILTHFYDFYYDEERNIYCNDVFFKSCYNINANVIISLKNGIRDFEYEIFQKFIDRYY